MTPACPPGTTCLSSEGPGQEGAGEGVGGGPGRAESRGAGVEVASWGKGVQENDREKNSRSGSM